MLYFVSHLYNTTESVLWTELGLLASEADALSSSDSVPMYIKYIWKINVLLPLFQSLIQDLEHNYLYDLNWRPNVVAVEELKPGCSMTYVSMT